MRKKNLDRPVPNYGLHRYLLVPGYGSIKEIAEVVLGMVKRDPNCLGFVFNGVTVNVFSHMTPKGIIEYYEENNDGVGN